MTQHSPSFQEACRSEPVGNGVYERTLDEHFWGHDAQFGGYAHALVVAAMTAEIDDIDLAPMSMSMHFMRPFVAGEFRCAVTLVRRGRTMANVHASVWSAGKLAAQAIATFARRRAVGAFVAAVPPPELASPVFASEASRDPQMGIPTHRLFEFWPRVGSSAERRADQNRVGGWVRMRDEPVVDELTLVMINDIWVPVAYHLSAFGHVAVSADITTQFRASMPAAIAPGEPVFVQLRTAVSAGGFVDEDTEVWSASGELLCQGRQMRYVHDTRDR